MEKSWSDSFFLYILVYVSGVIILLEVFFVLQIVFQMQWNIDKEIKIDYDKDNTKINVGFYKVHN